jgi:hypothetical protein
MATYTDANGVKLITTGDEAGTWGSSTNVNLQILDRAANGFESIALSSTTYTLTLSAQPSSAEDGHYKAIQFTGSPGGTCTVTLSQNDKARVYMILNSTDENLIITQGSGGNVTIEVGKGSIVLADGAGSGAAVTDFTAAVQNVTDLSSPFNVGATSVTTSGAELNLLDGSAAGTIANSKALIYGSSGEVNATTLQLSGTSITATAAELNYVDGVTSAIQTQIDAKQPLGTVAVTVSNPGAGNRYYIDGSLQQTVEIKPSVTYRFDQSDSSNATHPLKFSTTSDGTHGGGSPFTTGVTVVGTPGSAGAYTQVKLEQDAPTVLYYYCTNHSGMGGKAIVRISDFSASRVLVSDTGGDVSASDVTTTELNVLDGLTASTSELNIMDGVTASTSELNILDGVTATSTELNVLDGITATTTELNYVDGVTSSIQTQLGGKQATITGAATTIDDTDLTASRAVVSNASGKVAVSSVTSTELGYVSGVTSAIQTQLGGKQDTITGAATTIDDTDLTASRVLVSNSSGKVAASTTTTTELGNFIDGSSLNASNLDSGTVSDARLPSSISSDITGNAATATSAGTVTGAAQTNITSLGTLTTLTVDDITIDGSKISDAGNLEIETGSTLTLDAASGGITYQTGTHSFMDDGTSRAKFDFNTASTMKMSVWTGSSYTEELRLTTSGANVLGGLRVGDTTAPTDNDIHAAADISANGVFKLTSGSSDWTIDVDSNELFLKYGGASKAKIPNANSVVGYLGEQSSSTWTTGTGTTESLISPTKLRGVINNQLNITGSAPAFAVRAFVKFAGDGSVSSNQTISASGNVASVYKNSSGNFTVTFDTAMPDEHYCITYVNQFGTTARDDAAGVMDVYAQSASAFSFTTADASSNSYQNYIANFITIVR